MEGTYRQVKWVSHYIESFNDQATILLNHCKNSDRFLSFIHKKIIMNAKHHGDDISFNKECIIPDLNYIIRRINQIEEAGVLLDVLMHADAKTILSNFMIGKYGNGSNTYQRITDGVSKPVSPPVIEDVSVNRNIPSPEVDSEPNQEWKGICISEDLVIRKYKSLYLVRMPRESKYKYYRFWISNKLLRYSGSDIYELRYTDNFTFHIQKRCKGNYNKYETVDELELSAAEFEDEFALYDPNALIPEIYYPDHLDPVKTYPLEELIDD